MGKIFHPLLHNWESTQEKIVLQGQEKLKQSLRFIRCEGIELQDMTW